MHRRLGAGLLALVGIMGTALAADLSAPSYPTTKAPAVPASVYNWSGFYVGVNAGGDWYGGEGFVGGSNIESRGFCEVCGATLGAHGGGPH